MKFSVILVAFILLQSKGYAKSCLKIGILGEFKRPTGSVSNPFGIEIQRGAVLAKKEIQEKKKLCLEFNEIDIESTIANIDGNIRKASAQGIKYFVGLGTTEQALIAKRALIETQSILVTPTASGDELVTFPTGTILLFPRNSKIVKSIVNSIVKRKIKEVVSIYASNNVYSTEVHTIFKEMLKGYGINVKAVAIRAGAVDLQAHVNLFKKSKTQYIFLPLFELDAAKVISFFDRLKIETIYFGTDSWGTYSEVIQKLTKGTKIEAYVPVIYDSKNSSLLNNLFVSRYRAQFLKNPTDLSAFSFDAINLVLKMDTICSELLWNINLCLKKIGTLESTTGIVKFQKNYAVRSVRIKKFGQGVDE